MQKVKLLIEIILENLWSYKNLLEMLLPNSY